MRRALLAIHRYAALVLGACVALMGLTGASLVYKDEIAARLHPERKLGGAAAAPSYAAVLRRALDAVPGATRVSIYPRDGQAFRVLVDAPRARLLYVDPRDGTLISRSGRTEYALEWIEELHTHLLGGDTGESVAGLFGVALLVLAITGFVQAWPRRLSLALRIRWNAPSPWLAYDLHRVAGLLAGVLLLVNAATGAMLAFPLATRAAVNAIAGAPRPAEQGDPARTAGPSAPLDALVEAAERAIPGARASRVVVRVGAPTISIRVHAPGDHLPQGLGSVTLDARDASVLAVAPRDSLTPGQRLFDWLLPLHSGLLLGEIHRAILVFAGVIPALLLATGLVVWSRRKRPRPSAPAIR